MRTAMKMTRRHAGNGYFDKSSLGGVSLLFNNGLLGIPCLLWLSWPWKETLILCVCWGFSLVRKVF